MIRGQSLALRATAGSLMAILRPVPFCNYCNVGVSLATALLPDCMVKCSNDSCSNFDARPRRTRNSPIEANASDHGGALVALNAPRKNYVFQMEITFSMFAPKLRK